MIDTTQTRSAGWWLDKLMRKLEHDRPGLDLLHQYVDGNPPLPWGPANAQEAFRRFQRKARANWAELIVEAVRERMKVVGFRTGAAGDELGDLEAWRIWQANGLDAGSAQIHRTMLALGVAYAIVGAPDPETGAPLITGEDPRQVIAATDPTRRARTIAAAKLDVDEWTGDPTALLYLPGEVWYARGPSQPNGEVRFDPGSWEFYDRRVIPGRVVPVVRFANRPDLAGVGCGEYEHHLDDLDRINMMLLQRLVVAVLQAFRQRAVTGLPEAEEGDDWSDVFRADPGALWALPEGVQMWESAGVDLTPLLESVKADIRDLAAATRTPMFYLFPDSANSSAEGASLQREGLVFKTADRIETTSESWERVMSLAFLFSGDTERARLIDTEALWAPPERFSLAERFDAASKASAAGVPWRTVMTDVLQFTPQQVARMEAERATDMLFADGADLAAAAAGL